MLRLAVCPTPATGVAANEPPLEQAPSPNTGQMAKSKPTLVFMLSSNYRITICKALRSPNVPLGPPSEQAPALLRARSKGAPSLTARTPAYADRASVKTTELEVATWRRCLVIVVVVGAAWRWSSFSPGALDARAGASASGGAPLGRVAGRIRPLRPTRHRVDSGPEGPGSHRVRRSR